MSDIKMPDRSWWLKAVVSELLILAFELLLIFLYLLSQVRFSFFSPLPPLLIDLMLVSPLKAGRSFLYDTIATQSSTARVSLLFRYCGHGYWKTIRWRFGLWFRYACLFSLASLPAVGVFFFLSLLVEKGVTLPGELLHIGFTFIGLLIWIGGILTAGILLIRYEVSSFLLPYRAHSHTLFSDAAKLCKKKTGALLSIRCRYLLWLPLFLLVVPYFYATVIYRTEQAVAIRKMLGKFPEKKLPQALKRAKNHGIIEKVSSK